jgi:signal peptidase I
VIVFSLAILVVILTASLLVPAWAMTCAARRVGSRRARMRFGLIANVVLTMLNAPVILMIERFHADMPPLGLAGDAIAVLLAAVITYVVVRIIFRLSVGLAFAPFGANIIASAALAGLTIGVWKPLVVEPFVIPTRSMSPTIQPGDRVVVNKLLPPRRWDIVAYWSSGAGSGLMVYCKRLIGLPGERLRFENGNIFINDKLMTAPAVIAGRCHASVPSMPPDDIKYRDGQTIVLGADEFFFIGDNLDISVDSRWQGPSKRTALVGVADLLYWPQGRFSVLR